MLISIIIPSFQIGNELENALQSIENQDFKSLEVLIIDALENIVFRSFHDDLDRESSHFMPGEYESSASIPANLLREGTYFIRLKIGLHNVRWIVEHEIEYEFNIAKIDSLNSNYNDDRPGIIMPVVDWNTKLKNLD